MAETATVMAEEVQPETKKAFMSKKYSREERIKKDEEELEQLLKEQRGEVEEFVIDGEQFELVVNSAVKRGIALTICCVVVSFLY